MPAVRASAATARAAPHPWPCRLPQSGTVGIFSWGDFGDVSDRLLGHPESVDAMAAISEDVIVTGSSDGMIRVVGIHPNKV